jgi:hypothetical protein
VAEFGDGARPQLSFAPLADDPGAWSIPSEIPEGLTGGGARLWLSDVRVDLTAPEPVWTMRTVLEVVTPEGLQRTGGFDVVYRPDCERVVIHHVRVHRNGQVREAGRPEAFEIMRREVDLERASYDGRLTAHMVISDLRVGDVVDTAYSITGDPPTLRGRFSILQPLQWSVPAAESRVIVHAPAERRLVAKTYGAPAEHAEQTTAGVTERTWRTRNTPAWRDEDDAPSWWIGHSAVLVTDDVSWAEVADLFRPAYDCAIAAGLPPELEAAAERIEAASPDPQDRIPAALRLVQAELRYHAVSIGDGGFVPRSCDRVWSGRFGDCKDASVLLTSLLRRLGADAVPTLVHTSDGWRRHDDPPHPLAFNHCIVRVRHAGRDWWLDPTEAPQAGRLERLGQPRLGWALPLVEGAQLVSMGEDALETSEETREVWRFGDRPSSDVELEVRSVHRGWNADGFRRFLRSEGVEGVSRRFREHEEREYGGLTMVEPVLVSDHEGDNEVEILERYRLHQAWVRSPDGKTATFSIADLILGPNLTTPEAPARRSPIDLGRPRRVRVTRDEAAVRASDLERAVHGAGRGRPRVLRAPP